MDSIGELYSKHRMGDADTNSSSSLPFRHRWDVFLSFVGEDARHSLTGRLCKAMDEKGIRVFEGDEYVSRENLIDPIYDSVVSIIIFSPSYGASRERLEGLVKICELNRLILPVFYKVDPSNVRRQVGPFKEDFRRHEERLGEQEVLQWRKALLKVGGISGWASVGRYCFFGVCILR